MPLADDAHIHSSLFHVPSSKRAVLSLRRWPWLPRIFVARVHPTHALLRVAKATVFLEIVARLEVRAADLAMLVIPVTHMFSLALPSAFAPRMP
jgi:hypothetical protein